jgi:hypothetical protein
VATLILSSATLVATRPRLSASLVTGLLVVAGVALLGGGIVGAVAGERDFERHEEEHVEEEAKEYLISASGTDRFDQDELRIPADRPVTITFENREEDRPHGLLIQGLGPEDATTGVVDPGERATVEVEAPPGRYTYIDIEFPDELQGSLIAEAVSR